MFQATVSCLSADVLDDTIDAVTEVDVRWGSSLILQSAMLTDRDRCRALGDHHFSRTKTSGLEVLGSTATSASVSESWKTTTVEEVEL